MSEILIGTSGYFYDDWTGAFYPEGTAKKDYLTYYAGHFRVLELNFSYYRIPETRQSGRMLESSEGNLDFVVKAYRGLTHEISENSIKEFLPRFMEGISPFTDGGKLGAILLQFPQSFHYGRQQVLYQSLDRVACAASCSGRIPPQRMAERIGLQRPERTWRGIRVRGRAFPAFSDSIPRDKHL